MEWVETTGKSRRPGEGSRLRSARCRRRRRRVRSARGASHGPVRTSSGRSPRPRPGPTDDGSPEAGSPRPAPRATADRRTSADTAVDDRRRGGVDQRRRRRGREPRPSATEPRAPSRAAAHATRPRPVTDRRQRRDHEQRAATDASREDACRAVAVEDVRAAAEEFAGGLVDAFGLQATTSSTVDGNEIEVRIDADGDGLGLLIGPGGRTLLAIQDLARVAAQRRLGDHDTRLRIDVAGYREKRRVALERFARDGRRPGQGVGHRPLARTDAVSRPQGHPRHADDDRGGRRAAPRAKTRTAGSSSARPDRTAGTSTILTLAREALASVAAPRHARCRADRRRHRPQRRRSSPRSPTCPARSSISAAAAASPVW